MITITEKEGGGYSIDTGPNAKLVDILSAIKSRIRLSNMSVEQLDRELAKAAGRKAIVESNMARIEARKQELLDAQV